MSVEGRIVAEHSSSRENIIRQFFHDYGVSPIAIFVFLASTLMRIDDFAA